jgi:hypothetical protein
MSSVSTDAAPVGCTDRSSIRFDAVATQAAERVKAHIRSNGGRGSLAEACRYALVLAAEQLGGPLAAKRR